MNEHVGRAVFNARVQPEPPPKPQRRPLGLAPVVEEVLPISALDKVPQEVLNSPATIADVLQSLDAAVSIRSDIDHPLKVRIARLEGDNGALRDNVAALQVTVSRLRRLVSAMRKAAPRKRPAS
jgi:hypothetical protein